MPKIEIKVPDLGMESEQISFGAWLAETGQRISAGDDLFEVEADKATVVCEAEDSGTLVEVAVTEGTVKTGEVIGYIDA